jgi:hypothetical protein
MKNGRLFIFAIATIIALEYTAQYPSEGWGGETGVQI